MTNSISEVITELLDTYRMVNIRVTDVVEIIILAFLIYEIMVWIKKTRAWVLLKGFGVLLVFIFIAILFDMNTILWLARNVFSLGITALVIVFQPELRRALEQMGRNGVSKPFTLAAAPKDAEAELQLQRKGILAVGEACMTLQKLKMGALIVFERKTKLKEIVDTGTVVNAEPTAAIIGNIFFNKAPLHDGAMVMRDGMVYAAGCILPLTKNDSISIDLGTRHRAAIGMSENSDAVVVVVSEETGQISIAVNGILTRNYTKETLINALETMTLPESSGDKKSGFFSVRKRGKKE